MEESKETNRSVPHDWREGRRLRAWALHQAGWKQKDIAAALGVTPGAVSQWLKKGSSGGVESLRRHPAPGPTPRLTPEQRTQVPALLACGAEGWGFRGPFWTTTRIASVIERE